MELLFNYLCTFISQGLVVVYS